MQLVALMASKISGGAVAIDRANFTEQCGFLCSFSKSIPHIGSNPVSQKVELRKSSKGHCFSVGLCFSSESFWNISGKPYSYLLSRKHIVLCCSAGTRSSEAKECLRNSEDYTDVSRGQLEDEQAEGNAPQLCDHHIMPGCSPTYSARGLAEACKFVYNDAKFVNERARNDIILLSRGITRLNDRARQDVAVLGLGFLKLDARAREDTEKIDHNVKKKAACLHHIATILKDKAQSNLKRVADQHWSDGALEFVRNIHDMMVDKLQQRPLKQGYFSVNDMMGFITLEKNGKALDLFAREVSTDRITAIEEAYWSMASALSEADGIDYINPEELELLVATLIDLDAMDGKGSVSLLAECSSSPDVNTRQALANALAAAPSMWILGNAGMGALQRLAQDSNPAVAAAASKAIDELKQQWELEEGDCLRFMMNQNSQAEDRDDIDSEVDNS
uniref:Senescence-associated protein OSA15, chloroplastic isoform X2 n=1 Tax=Elaeis guineensis var. tenera TaxID=51953 RepID=A0A6I9QX66_ELAGV|nr:senescence-associated protein OSA15, chloroplastic isoform X2 [Elaeis guineensis]